MSPVEFCRRICLPYCGDIDQYARRSTNGIQSLSWCSLKPGSHHGTSVVSPRICVAVMYKLILHLCYRRNGGENACGEHPRAVQASTATQRAGQWLRRRHPAGASDDPEIAAIAFATSPVRSFWTTHLRKFSLYFLHRRYINVTPYKCFWSESLGKT